MMMPLTVKHGWAVACGRLPSGGCWGPNLRCAGHPRSGPHRPVREGLVTPVTHGLPRHREVKPLATSPPSGGSGHLPAYRRGSINPTSESLSLAFPPGLLSYGLTTGIYLTCL